MVAWQENAGPQTAEQQALLASLKRKMHAENLPLRSVAAALNCSQSTLSRQLNGKIGLRGPREMRIRNLIGPTSENGDLCLRLQSQIASLDANEMRAVLHFLQIVRDLRD